jgi:hypothetical protein
MPAMPNELLRLADMRHHTGIRLWLAQTIIDQTHNGRPRKGGRCAQWRWRESNPRPSASPQGFSGRSLL